LLFLGRDLQIEAWYRTGELRIDSYAGCPAFCSWKEAAAYFGIGINKLREIINDSTCNFVLWVGSKRLTKRKRLDACVRRSEKSPRPAKLSSCSA
jgi:hypothetical protein